MFHSLNKMIVSHLSTFNIEIKKQTTCTYQSVYMCDMKNKMKKGSSSLYEKTVFAL